MKWDIPRFAAVGYICIDYGRIKNTQYASRLDVHFEDYVPKLISPVTYGKGDIHFIYLF